jgi:hypothetical protein
MFRVFQMYVAYVSSGSDVAYVAMAIHVLQVYVSAVLNICCKCFFLDIVYVTVAIHVGCKCMF